MLGSILYHIHSITPSVYRNAPPKDYTEHFSSSFSCLPFSHLPSSAIYHNRGLRRSRGRSGSRRGVDSGKRRSRSRSNGRQGRSSRTRSLSHGRCGGSRGRRVNRGRSDGGGRGIRGTSGGRTLGDRRLGLGRSRSVVLNGLTIGGRVGGSVVDDRDRDAGRKLSSVDGQRDIGALAIHQVGQSRVGRDGRGLEQRGHVDVREGLANGDVGNGRVGSGDNVDGAKDAAVADKVGLDLLEEVLSGRVGAGDCASDVRDGQVGVDVRGQLSEDGRDAKGTVGQVVGVRDGDRGGAEEAAVRFLSVVVGTVDQFCPTTGSGSSLTSSSRAPP